MIRQSQQLLAQLRVAPQRMSSPACAGFAEPPFWESPAMDAKSRDTRSAEGAGQVQRVLAGPHQTELAEAA
jgi:hypothetical protein